MLYPLAFHPILKERVWGGRKLEELYQKSLPSDLPIGESWEICDRPGDVSVIANGPLAGRDLNWLMENHRDALLGGASSRSSQRFPWLIKILDAQEILSVQVHPPAQRAAEFGGEPKTEMWYIAHAEPGAELFVGLKRNVTADEFARRIADGTVAQCLHRVTVCPGDVMFLPSGRVHAIGAGIVLFEIQQNSDTTFRVFDWNRLGLDGQPRALHIRESLASIDFNDFEPSLLVQEWRRQGPLSFRRLVRDSLFNIELLQAEARTPYLLSDGLRALGMVKGRATIMHAVQPLELAPGQFCLLPASVKPVEAWFESGSASLLIAPGD